MATLPGGTYGSPNNAYYASASEAASNWYKFSSLTGTVFLVDASGTQILQSIGSNLYYNGDLLAKAGDISNIGDWSLYPAVASIQMDSNSIIGANDVAASTVHTSSLVTSSLSTNSFFTSTIGASGSLDLSGSALIYGPLNVSSTTIRGALSTTSAVIGSGLGTNVTIANGTVTANGLVSGAGLATTAGLNMTNTSINNANTLKLSAAGLPPYGNLTSPDGASLTWNGAVVNTGGAGSASNWSYYPQLQDLATFTATQISTASLGVSSINGSQYPPPAGDVTQWALNPALSTVQLAGLGAVGVSTFTDVSSINGITYVPTQQWSGYYATGNVTLDGNTLQAGTNKNMLINSGECNVNITSYYNTNVTASNQIYIKADTGASLTNTPYINLTAQNGPLGGNIELDAYAGYGAIAGYGKISLNAFASSNDVVPVGGLITLNAYSGGIGEYGGLTSAIRATAASIGLSAGALPSIPATAGTINIYGNNIVSITAGLPGILPQVPGTMYGYGVTGITLESPGYIDLRTQGVYAQTIYPSDSGANLVIRGRTFPTAGVTLMDVEKINMVQGAGGQITAVSSINYMTIEDASLKRVSSIEVSTINGYAFPQTVAIPSTFTDLNASSIFTSSISAIDGSTLNLTAPVGQGLIQAGDFVNGGFLDINNQSQTSTLNFAALGNDLGGVYIGGNNNTNFSLLAMNPDGVPNADLTVPRGFFNIDASGVSISTNLINISTANFFAGDISGAFLSINNVDPTPGLNFASLANDYGGIFVGGNTNTNYARLAMNTDGTSNADLTVPRGNLNIDASTINVSSHQMYLSSSVTVGGTVIMGDVNVDTGPYIEVNPVTSTLFLTNNHGITLMGNSGVADYASIRLNDPAYGTGQDCLIETSYPGAKVQIPFLSTLNAATSVVSVDSAGSLYKTPFVPNFVTQYNYYVAVNGNNSTGNGSISAPYATISGALAATTSIPDSNPISIFVSAGTYTESPTVTRNNTFLVGAVGISDVVVIGTLSFTPGATAQPIISQGVTGMSIVGNIVCSETTATEVNWYLDNVNVTSYGVSAVGATGNATGNTSLNFNSCIITQNTTPSAAVQLVSCRANLTLVQVLQNTTSPALSLFSGNSSVACNGTTLTCAGTATAGAVVFVNNTLATGSTNSFLNTTFQYTASNAGVGKTGVQFSNSVNLPQTTFNQCIWYVGGSTTIITKPGTGTISILWGQNTCSPISAIPTGVGITNAYMTQDFIRANTLRDSFNSAGGANQVLTAGTGGSSLVWNSQSIQNLIGWVPTPAATAYQNSLVMYNSVAGGVTYDTNAYTCVVVTAPSTNALATTMRGRTYIATSTGAQNLTFTTATLTANDVGFFVKVKNGNPTGGGDITIVGATGNTVIHNKTATTSGGIGYLYWNGTALIAY